ncbi:MAG TPA: hypothetical protein VG895_04570 [Patescibacteria group bacterium]|nr:hypothetical protein [Patescibacteria group bacterium]
MPDGVSPDTNMTPENMGFNPDFGKRPEMPRPSGHHVFERGGSGAESKQEFPRPFSEVQNELKTLINNPDPQKEKTLKTERARIIRSAQEQGVFKQLKNALIDIQLNNDYKTAYGKINALNVEELEDFEKGVEGWNDAYDGILSEYRDVAVLNMALALGRAGGAPENSPKIAPLKREIGVRGWGLPPQALESQAKSYLNEELKKQQPPKPDTQEQLMQQMIAYIQMLQQGGATGLTAEDIARGFAMASGEGSPEQQLEIYETVERGAYAPVDMTLKVPAFLLIGHNNPKEREIITKEWKARASIWSFAAYKRAAVSYDKLTDNQLGYQLENSTLENGMKINGVFNAAALYSTVISDDKSIRFIHIPNNDMNNPGEIRSVFDIKTNEQFDSFRKGMWQFLMDKTGVNEEDAKKAEAVAWNLIYATSVLEEYDSVYNYDNEGHVVKRNDRNKPIPNAAPSHFKSPAMWMVMHPQERLFAKATGGTPEAMGQAGEWSLQYKNVKNIDKFPVVLPRKTIGNALKAITFKPTSEIDAYGITKDKDGKVNLFEVLQHVGREIWSNGSASVSANNIPWKEVGNTPFSGYYLEDLGSAKKLYDVIMKGQGSGINGQELSNVVKKLKLDNSIRENILKLWFGIKNKSKGFNFIQNDAFGLNWMQAKSAFTSQHRDYFK